MSAPDLIRAPWHAARYALPYLAAIAGALYCRLHAGKVSPATLHAAPDLYAAAYDALQHLTGQAGAVGKGEAIGRLHDALRKADGGAA